MLQAVVFDLDGLMFNTEELYQHVGTEILRRRGKPFEPELIDAMMGRPGPVALRIMIDWHQLDATVEDLSAESEEVFGTLLDERLRPMPGLLDLLAALEAADLPKAIATSSPRRFASDVLARHDLEPRFEFVLTGDDVEHGKPHPEIYLSAAERFSLAPKDLLVLEDSANGCAAAVAAGAFVVATPSGRSHAHEFPGSKLIARSLGDPVIYDALGIVRS
jgi:HAD superfamily hydrolase (TIGR01509 family)